MLNHIRHVKFSRLQLRAKSSCGRNDGRQSWRKFSTEITYHTLRKSLAEVAHVTFKGNKKYAFVNKESLVKLTSVFDDLARQKNLSGVFLRSTFPGADIKEMASLGDWVAADEFISNISNLCTLIYSSPFPVVAVTEGPCLGAGMEVVASCDLRIAVENSATFGMPETKLGVPSVAQASLIPGLIGWGRAKELLFFGETIDAYKAYEWGFVNTLTTTDNLDQTIRDYENKIDNVEKHAIRAQKRVMQHWQRTDAGIIGNTDFPNHEFAQLVKSGRPSKLMNQFLGIEPSK